MRESCTGYCLLSTIVAVACELTKTYIY